MCNVHFSVLRFASSRNGCANVFTSTQNFHKNYTKSFVGNWDMCVFSSCISYISSRRFSVFCVFFPSFILWCVRKECRFHLNKFYWCFTDFFDILAWRNNAMINEWTNILHQPNDGTRTLCEMQFVFRECVMIGQSANFIFIRSNNIVANVLTLCVFSFVFCCCSFAFWLNN